MREQGGPLVSVVIPTYNRRQQLSACLRALAEVDYPSEDLEVIVVDDGSDDPVSNTDVEVPGLRVQLCRQENRGPAAARNFGIERARGRLLAFIDDDCRPARTWLAELTKAHRLRPKVMLGGSVVNALVDNRYAATSQLLLELVYNKCNRQLSDATFFTSNNMAVPAEPLRALGGFDNRFRTSEDRELCDRWRAAGGTLTFVPEAVVRHAHEMDLKDFCRQHFGYGRGASAFHRLRRRRGSGDMRYSLDFHKDPRNWLTPAFGRGVDKALLLAVMELANVAGFLSEELLREMIPRGENIDLWAPERAYSAFRADPPDSAPTSTGHRASRGSNGARPPLERFIQPRVGDDPLPLVLEPRTHTDVETLVTCLEDHSGWVQDKLVEHGALLLRGFDMGDAEQFEAVCRAIDPNVSAHWVGTPSNRLAGCVYPASEGPTEYPVPMHCELSYLPVPPARIFFGCLVPPEPNAGETPLVDNRRVWRELDPEVRARFEDAGGVRIVRNTCGPDSRFRLWTQIRWDEYFCTTDRREVERLCESVNFAYEWTADDGLRLEIHQPVIRTHPVSGETAWCSQLLSDNVTSSSHNFAKLYRLRPSARMWRRWQFVRLTAALKGHTPKSALRCYCTYPDGSAIPDADIRALRDTVWKNYRYWPWHVGDVVAIDNIAASHARFPSWGHRRIIACMA